MALGERHRLEQRQEALLLDEQDGAVAVVGSAGREDRQLRQADLQLRQRVLVTARRCRRTSIVPSGTMSPVWLVEVAAGVEHDVPLGRRVECSVMKSGKSCCVKY